MTTSGGKDFQQIGGMLFSGSELAKHLDKLNETVTRVAALLDARFSENKTILEQVSGNTARCADALEATEESLAAVGRNVGRLVTASQGAARERSTDFPWPVAIQEPEPERRPPQQPALDLGACWDYFLEPSTR